MKHMLLKLKIITILAIGFLSPQVFAQEFPRETKMKDLATLSNVTMEKELLEAIGQEDKDWKVPFTSRVYDFIFGKSGIYTTYRTNSFSLPGKVDESKSSPEQSKQRQAQVDKLIAEQRNSILPENLDIRQMSDLEILNIYKKLFANTKSPLSSVVSTVLGEKRILIEQIISGYLKRGISLLDIVTDLKKRKQFISKKRFALIQAVRFKRDIENGILVDATRANYLPGMVNGLYTQFARRSELVMRHNLPLFIEFESAALNETYAPVTFELWKALKELFDGNKDLAPRIVQTPQSGVSSDGNLRSGGILVFRPEAVPLVDKFIQEFTKEISRELKTLIAISFTTEAIRKNGKLVGTTIVRNEATAAARKAISDLWKTGEWTRTLANGETELMSIRKLAELTIEKVQSDESLKIQALISDTPRALESSIKKSSVAISCEKVFSF